MSDDITLKEFIGKLEERLDKFESKLDTFVTEKRLESKMHQVEELRAMVNQQDDRIDSVEHFQGVLKYVGGLLVLIIMALITTYLTGLI